MDGARTDEDARKQTWEGVLELGLDNEGREPHTEIIRSHG